MLMVDLAIVGAGPYGLSLAAHLRPTGIPLKIFGKPMQTWSQHMPDGMLLKSDGFASNLSDPARAFTLRHFCAENDLHYDDTRTPVSLATFVNYGRAFQKRMVPELDERQVIGVEKNANGFLVKLEDGDSLQARRVVLAVGISHFAFVPPNLSSLPAQFLSHSSAIKDLAPFQEKDVAIIGAGASAIDIAALLLESGAKPQVVARRSAITFHAPPGPRPRTIWQQMRHPASGLGPGWKSRFFTDAPGLFRYFPERLRLRLVEQHLGPAPGWPMRERVEGKVPMSLGTSNLQATVQSGKAHLTFVDRNGHNRELFVDHVITATGYRVNVDRLAFLSPAIRMHLKTLAGAPALSPDFQSSVPGLYFTGIAAANTFGPMMRFAFGAAYTAKKISAHLVRTRGDREPAQADAPATSSAMGQSREAEGS